MKLNLTQILRAVQSRRFFIAKKSCLFSKFKLIYFLFNKNEKKLEFFIR